MSLPQIEVRPKVTLVAYAKNEGRFLLEWMAYHRLIGVTDFLLFTNDCEDESPAMLDRVQEMGLAVHIPNPVGPGEKPQNMALRQAEAHPLVRSADYVLQIDVDEFLCIKAGGGAIGDLAATAPEADIICLQMRFFGDSGLPSLGPEPVVEQLVSAALEGHRLNGIVKSLARNNGRLERVVANHMPKFRAEGPQPRIFNGGGIEIAPAAYGHDRFRVIPDAYRSFANAQLNHYAVRTFADYCAKRWRGTPAGNDAKLTQGYWRERNRNEQVDLSIQRWAPATRAMIAGWLEDPALAVCERRCREAYDAIRTQAVRLYGPSS